MGILRTVTAPARRLVRHADVALTVHDVLTLHTAQSAAAYDALRVTGGAAHRADVANRRGAQPVPVLAHGAERVWRRSGTAKVFDLTDRDRPFQLQATVNQLLWNDVIGVCRIAP